MHRQIDGTSFIIPKLHNPVQLTKWAGLIRYKPIIGVYFEVDIFTSSDTYKIIPSPNTSLRKMDLLSSI